MTKDLIEVVAREAGRRKFRRVGMGPSLKRHKHELQMPALPPLLPIIPTAAIITTTPSKGCSAAGQPSALQPLPSLSSSPQHEQQPREEGLVLLLRRQRLRIPAIACMCVGGGCGMCSSRSQDKPSHASSREVGRQRLCIPAVACGG